MDVEEPHPLAPCGTDVQAACHVVVVPGTVEWPRHGLVATADPAVSRGPAAGTDLMRWPTTFQTVRCLSQIPV